jgi:serine/threonine-protein kinase
MAAVFAARQSGPLGFGRLVALKVMSTALLGDESLEQLFIREAGISARLQHDNIVRVYEVDEADGTYYIAMELVHGATLREIKLDKAPPLPITVTVLSELASALHYAHTLRDATGQELGVVHQDVSPHNVMITYGGVTKLLDFGVARIGQLDASRTETVRGKPAYVSPEQLVGDRIDRRTDVFSLGILMHELLTGKRLFGGGSNDITTYEAVLRAPIPRPTDVPDAIADVCLKALTRASDGRYATAQDFANALRGAIRAVNVEPASREEIADWLAHAAPPKWSLEALELETLDAPTPAVGLEEIEDLPTRTDAPLSEVPPPPVLKPEDTSGRRSRLVAPAPSSSGAWWGLGAGALALGIGAGVMFMRVVGEEPREPSGRAAEASTPHATTKAPRASAAPTSTASVSASAPTMAAPVPLRLRPVPQPRRPSPQTPRPAGGIPSARD